MKRFYKHVSTEQVGEVWRILLDERPIKTPAKVDLTAPTEAMAEVLAAEWAEQGDTIDVQGMHLTRLANVAIDRTPGQRGGMVDEVVKYCETDLLCFLAETPADLRARQIEQWRPVREWAGKQLDVLLLEVPDGVLAASQPPASLAAARVYAEGLDDLQLTGLNFGLGLFGSALLSMAVSVGHITAQDAYERSILDELYQSEMWGQDDENLARLSNNRTQAAALSKLFSTLSV